MSWPARLLKGNMKTISERKAEAEELRRRIDRLSAVSPDTASREGFNLAAIQSAIRAEEEDKCFFSADGGKGVLVLSISALPAEKRAEFISACGGWKSRRNSALLVLDGERGEIRRNAAGTCWVIDLASSRRAVMFAWAASGGTKFSGPRLNTTNGGGHWCGLVSSAMPIDPERNPKTVAFVQQAMACLAENGMTPRQWESGESARRVAEQQRRDAIVRAATEARKLDGYVAPSAGYVRAAEELSGSTDLVERIRARVAADRLAAEEARIMAELEAEQVRIAAEKAAAEAAARRQAAIAATYTAAGISPEQWQGMTPKQQGLALHRARLAGRIP